MRYRFSYVGADLCCLAFQPNTSTTLQYHEYGLVYYAMCLFTKAGFSISPTHRGQLGLSRPGCLVLRRGGVPVQRRSLMQALYNRPWRRVTTLIKTNVLPLRQTGNSRRFHCVLERDQ